jgi:hypothetical protein
LIILLKYNIKSEEVSSFLFWGDDMVRIIKRKMFFLLVKGWIKLSIKIGSFDLEEIFYDDDVNVTIRMYLQTGSLITVGFRPLSRQRTEAIDQRIAKEAEMLASKDPT